MKEIKSAEEIHGILLNLGKEFHKICVKNNIPYFMVGGTLLGAIRHKGFIPWDDDMDFGVPREYFEKLKTILTKELPSRYKVLTMENSDSLLLDFIKISDEMTEMRELFKENSKESFGVNIDIFPFDKTSKQRWIAKLRLMVLQLSMYVLLSAKSRPIHKKCIAYFLKCLFFWLDKYKVRSFINRFLLPKNGSYRTNIYGAWGLKETVPSEYIGNPVLYDFEDTQLYGIVKPDDYLKCIYGDYMKLPPENKRHIHITGAFWK